MQLEHVILKKAKTFERLLGKVKGQVPKIRGYVTTLDTPDGESPFASITKDGDTVLIEAKNGGRCRIPWSDVAVAEEPGEDERRRKAAERQAAEAEARKAEKAKKLEAEARAEERKREAERAKAEADARASAVAAEGEAEEDSGVEEVRAGASAVQGAATVSRRPKRKKSG